VGEEDDVSPVKTVRRFLARPWVMQGFFATCVLGMLGHYGFGCSGWDPRRPFERSNADVDRAIQMIEDGEYENAQEVLSDYLGGGQCKNGKIELTDKARKKADGTFDLGLVLFYLAEKYGRRFGEEAVPEGGVDDAELVEKRDLEIKCGLIVAVGIARDPQLPPDLRARAMYLAGNLEFLRGNYKDAIKYYEESLKLVPGIPEDQQGDGIGRDAAWNRATALRRLEKEQEKDGGQQEQEPQPQPQPQDDPQNPQGPEKQDGGGDDKGDAGNDAGDKESPEANDAGPDGGQDGGPEDGGKNGSQSPDAGDSPQDPRDPQNQDPEQADPGGPSGQQGDRVLDQFEQVPTYQQEDAKKRSEGRRRNMEDK
jgi:tetratricopeptide (TPR) repeat protein